MATKDNSAAQSVVFGNLGVDQADLDSDIQQSDAELESDTGSYGDDPPEPAEPRVSHTERDGFERGDERGESYDQRQRTERGQQQRRPIPSQAEVRADQSGNLIDPSGRIIARAGREARLYQQGFKAAYNARGGADPRQLDAQRSEYEDRLNQATQISTELIDTVRNYEARDAAIQEFGLSSTDQLDAIRLFSKLKTDTAGTLRNLLTRAQANGIDVLGSGANGGLDIKSVVDAIKEEIAPVRNLIAERQQEQQLAAASAAEQQEAEREVKSFFAANPQARQFVHVFHDVMKTPQGQGLSLREIWAEIRLNLATRRNGNGQSAQQNSRTPRSIPAGRRGPQGGSDRLAPVNESYENIVRGLVRELDVPRQ